MWIAHEHGLAMFKVKETTVPGVGKKYEPEANADYNAPKNIGMRYVRRC